MKIAILLATNKGDKLAVKVIEHGMYSDVLKEFKRRVAAGEGEPGYDTLAVWTGPPVKKYTRFQDAAPQGEDKASPVEAQVSGDVIPAGDVVAATTTELPHNTEQAGTGEGDLPGVQASTGETELPLAPPAENPQPEGEPSPGSMSPKKKVGR